MNKEVEELKKEIAKFKEELKKRPTKQEMEAYVAEYIFNNVPLRLFSRS